MRRVVSKRRISEPAAAIRLPCGLPDEAERLDGPADEVHGGHPEQLLRGAVRERDEAVRVRREDAGGHGAEDRPVEGLEARDLGLAALEVRAGLAELVRRVGDEKSRHDERARVKGDLAHEPGRRPEVRRAFGRRHGLQRAEVHEVDEDGVEDRREAGGDEAALAAEQDRPGRDGTEVEERETRVGAARDVDEPRDHDEVAEELDRGVRLGRDPVEGEDRGDRDRVRERGQVVDVVERQRRRERELDQERGQEDRRHDDDAQNDETPQHRVQRLERTSATRNTRRF